MEMLNSVRMEQGRRWNNTCVSPICRELVRLVKYAMKHVDLLLKIVDTMSLGL